MSCKDTSKYELFELLERAEILQRERGRVMDATISALPLGKRRTSQVDDWLDEVEKVIIEVKDLEAEYAAPKSCGSLLQGICCMNFRRKMTVKIRRTNDRIRLLMAKGYSLGDLAPVRIQLPPGDEHIVGLDSALNEVWSFIADDKVGIIGIHGPAGVGKTTLLKQVNNALIKRIPEFHHIIWVQLARHVSLKAVQDTICQRLGLSYPIGKSVYGEESEIERASVIFNALISKRFVIMLDGLWKRLELEKIGVPLAWHHQNHSKIIFTTRDREVCDRMKADKVFPLGILSEQDANYLLKMIVGDDIFHENPNLSALSPEIIQKCGRLPYAIVTVGNLLRGRRHEEEWRVVLHQLSSASSRADMGYLFAPLKLSYESLNSPTMKESFLYCSLLPEGYRIEKDQLVDYWIGEGFLGAVTVGMKDLRYKGYGIIEKLVNACLLEKEANFITMHRLVREMSLMIASEDREEGKYFVKAGVELNEVPVDEIPKQAEKISLMQSLVTKLPPSPPWSQVSTLLLSGNKFKEIPGDFFSIMPSLQVLDLSNCEIEELPATISLLQQLRYLNLSRTKLRSLYIGLQNLRNLEILYLSYIDGLHFIPHDLFVWLQSLRLLNMYHCGHRNWMLLDEKKKADLLIGDEAFLEELESLSRLDNLEISINGDPALEKFESSLKLQSCVSSVSIGGCATETVSTMKFKNLRILEVSSCPKLLNFKVDRPEMEATTSAGVSGQVYFNNLQHVKFEYCWSIQELSWLCFAPNLQTLHVEECMKLEKVIASQGDREAEAITGPFSSLKELCLRKLPSLTSISDFPLQFRSLQEISISYCPKLKRLPVNSKNANRALKMIKGEPQWFRALEWEDDKAENSFSPYFVPIY